MCVRVCECVMGTAAEVDQSLCSSSCLDSVSMQSRQSVCLCVYECVRVCVPAVPGVVRCTDTLAASLLFSRFSADCERLTAALWFQSFFLHRR